MFRVRIFYPPAMTAPVVKYYKSLRHAAINLKTSYYFLYNCYHKRHSNQFSSFFTVHEVDGDGVPLPYREPRSSDQRGKAKHKGRHKKKKATSGKNFKKIIKSQTQLKVVEKALPPQTNSARSGITTPTPEDEQRSCCADTELRATCVTWGDSWEQWPSEY